MKKWYLPVCAALLLTACGGEESPEIEEESQTEVSGPQGDDTNPSAPEEAKDAETTTVSDLVKGNMEEGTAVKISGSVEELVDDVAFPSFILSSEGQEIYIRNMAETAVEPGDSIQLEGIYDGNAEENLPLISASVIVKTGQ